MKFFFEQKKKEESNKGGRTKDVFFCTRNKASSFDIKEQNEKYSGNEI